MDTFEDWADSHRIDGRPLIEVIEDAYNAGVLDARESFIKTRSATVYRLRYSDGSFHKKIYRTAGLARSGRRFLYSTEQITLQELSGDWKDVGVV